MKKGLLILLTAIMAGIFAFFLSRGESPPDDDAVLLDSMPELAWIQTELKLNDEQFSKVKQLHRQHRPVCAEMCRRIADSEADVARLASAENCISDELSKAIESHGRVIAECKRSMLEHLYQTATLMDEKQARRFLEVTLPLALDSVHSGTANHKHE